MIRAKRCRRQATPALARAGPTLSQIRPAASLVFDQAERLPLANRQPDPADTGDKKGVSRETPLLGYYRQSDW